MRCRAAAGLAALLAACAPAEEAGRAADGCALRAASTWNAGADASLSVEATTSGPDCARAAATLAIRDAAGAVLFASAHPASQVMTLAQAHDAAAMQAALEEWVSAANPQLAGAAALPAWAADADAPTEGEFPFYPAEDVDREAYAELRRRDLPMFCYVQGMESLNCLTLEGGAVRSVGVQSFPG